MSHSEALPTTTLILRRRLGVNTPKRYRQLRVKDLPKVPTWRLEWDSNLRPSERKALNPTTEPPLPTKSGVRTQFIKAVAVMHTISILVVRKKVGSNGMGIV